MVFYLKSCPRCKGDLLLDNDFAGYYLSCMQCGFLKDIKIKTFNIEQIKSHSEKSPNKQKDGRTQYPKINHVQ